MSIFLGLCIVYTDICRPGQQYLTLREAFQRGVFSFSVFAPFLPDKQNAYLEQASNEIVKFAYTRDASQRPFRGVFLF